MSVVKALFALSCNRCSFPQCDLRLADQGWNGVRADVAHIRGERPGAARYDPEMTDVERNSIENLMLLCPNHHREIDRLQPQEWPTERLMATKLKHEQDCNNREWASDAALEFYSSLLIASVETPQTRTAPETVERPRLVIERGRGDTIEAVSVGNADARSVSVTTAPHEGRSGGMLQLESQQLRRLSLGGRWRAGLYVRTAEGGPPPVVVLAWQDDAGNEYDAEFPL